MLTLSAQELKELTGFARAGRQCAWLIAQGIPYKLDGKARRVIVLREHVTAWMEGRQIRQYVEPNWGAVR